MHNSGPFRALAVIAVSICIVWGVVAAAGRQQGGGTGPLKPIIAWEGSGSSSKELFRVTPSTKVKWTLEADAQTDFLQIEVLDIKGNVLTSPVNAQGSQTGFADLPTGQMFVSLRMLANHGVNWKVAVMDRTGK